VHLASARMTRSAHLALDSAGRFLLAVDRAGAVLWATPQAMRLIEASAGMAADRLPEAAIAWLGKAAGELSIAFGQPGSPRLLLSHIGRVGPDEILLRLAPDASEQAMLQTGLHVTAREAEVLLWVSRGKSNRDIAEILGLSPRTVNKHLEQIFHKLSVENRSSATALVMRALSDR
jgi:DNA-binding CsgD family transcriptional regulator